MRRFKFTKTLHEDLGEYGWLLVGSPSTYYPGHGMTTAHDILEHKRSDTGSVEDELCALGASLFVRGEGGWYSKHTAFSPGYNMANDVETLFYDSGGEIDSPGRTHACDVDNWITDAMVGARDNLYHHCLETYGRRHVQKFLQNIRGWMRRGYRDARKRYRHTDSYSLTYIFEAISRAADDLLPLADYHQVLCVDLSVKYNRVRIHLLDEWEV